MHKEWWNHGMLNRADGPAIEIEQEGLRRCEYWVEGRMHREDGPAFELTQTAMKQVVVREWLTDNKRHRMDGPAIECAGKLLSPTVQWP